MRNPKLADNLEIVVDLIDRFNAMLATLPGQSGLSHVRYLNLRGTLSKQLNKAKYKTSWGNELHPTNEGFEVVAKKFADLILTFP